jgi:predicted AAA+ superfamily ATPase
MGLLWEHYVLNELHARLQTRSIHYWRDKQAHQVDFVLARRGKAPLAIECKWSANDLEATSLKAFAKRYPKAQHFVVAQDVDKAYAKQFGSLDVAFSGLDAFVDRVQGEFEPENR